MHWHWQRWRSAAALARAIQAITRTIRLSILPKASVAAPPRTDEVDIPLSIFESDADQAVDGPEYAARGCR